MKSLEVDTLDIEVGLFLLLLFWYDEEALFDALNRSYKHLSEKALGEGEHKDLLILKVIAQLNGYTLLLLVGDALYD